MADSGRAIGGDQRRAHVAQEDEARRAPRAPRPRSASPSPTCSCRACRRRRRRSWSRGHRDSACRAPPTLALTTSATESSLEPFERKTEKVTTGSPLRRANERCSLASSTTWPRSDRRTSRPPGSRILVSASSSTLRAPASVRIACSWPPTSPRPPPRSTLVARTWRVDLGGGDAERQQPVGIEQDADLAIDAAVALDAADALQALQLALDDVVDMPGELLERHARRGGREREDRLALDVDALDDRLVDVARQIERGSCRWRP